MHETLDISGYLDEYRDTGDIVIRAKWTMDGAETLADAAADLRAFADLLEVLAEAGFHLRGPIEDDHGFLHRVEEMTASDVLEVIGLLEEGGIRYWIDGSWALAALGRRSDDRHDDLDVAVPYDQIHRAERALAVLGLVHADLIEPGMPMRLVLRDRAGRQVDVRPLRFDEDGDGYRTLEDDEVEIYLERELSGVGRVAGRTVPCVEREE